MRNKTLYILFSVGIFLAFINQSNSTIYLIGDSTMANKEENKRPETGWGQVLHNYFTEEIQIENHARNGRSSKSFYEEGLWPLVKEKLKPGDYVFIQFGHNDSKDHDPKRFTVPATGYRQQLVRYIEESRKKGARPVLLTSIVRRSFNEHDVLVDTHGLYPVVAREVANSYKVPFIDLQLMTEQMINEQGREKSKSMFLWLKPGENLNYLQGKEDNTHLNVLGANMVSKAVVEEIKRLEIGLTQYIK